MFWISAESRFLKILSKLSSVRTSRRIARVSLKVVASSVRRSYSRFASTFINDLRFIRSHVATSVVSGAFRPKTCPSHCSCGPPSGLLTTCFASNAQMEREVTQMAVFSYSREYCRISVCAKWVRMKSKSELGMGALTIWRIACKHTMRDRLITSFSPMPAPTLRRRTRRDSRKETDSIDGMSSAILCIGILAANFRNAFLSPSASWLNSQVTLPRSPLFNVVTARMKMLFSKPNVKYCQ